MMQKHNGHFKIQENEDNTLKSIINCNDDYQMDWVAEGKQWGKVTTPEGIEGTVSRKISETGKLLERYVFTNNKSTDYFGSKTGLSIAVPLPDNYKSADVCMKKRCHAHIWCGLDITYIQAVRMGGEGPHLGLVLTDGAVSGYSIHRDLAAISNDRGEIILHPKIDYLLPGETVAIEWELFWFEDREQFQELLLTYPGFIQVQADKYICFQGEQSGLKIICGDNYTEDDKVNVTQNGMKVPYEKKRYDERLVISVLALNNVPGDIDWRIRVGKTITSARTLVLPKMSGLIDKRCRFIAKKQQFHNKDSHLNGAYLIYDNEEERIYYDDQYDHNGGRERVGMGVLLADYLQKHKDDEIEESLRKYYQYVCRELYDQSTGIVYNDVKRNNEWHRLYNYPWAAVFFMEYYRLYKQQDDLHNMYQIIRTYYEQDGQKFYAIGIPMTESVRLLKEAGWIGQAEELIVHYQNHGDYIVKNGLHYPAHEVNYEQSIVAPAVCILLQVYELTGQIKYLDAAKEQLRVLELFNGDQPDYHLNETAIRHWDGYWFGKRKNLGDTFPHYWSALTGLAYRYYARITGDSRYQIKAEHSLRGVLSLFDEEGVASCAYIYPVVVNQAKGSYADPWANDQDWGLYFYLKEGDGKYE